MVNRCQECDTPNPVNNTFCVTCGRNLKNIPDPVSTTPFPAQTANQPISMPEVSSITNPPRKNKLVLWTFGGLGAIAVMLGVVLILAITNSPKLAQPASVAIVNQVTFTIKPTLPSTSTPLPTFTAIPKATATPLPIPALTPTPMPIPTATTIPFGNLIQILGRHSKAVTSLDCSPDGKVLASGSEDTTVKLWDSTKLQDKGNPITFNEPINTVAFSTDGKFLASGSADKLVNLWSFESNSLRPVLSGHGNPVLAVVYSPNGKYLGSGSSDNSIILRNAKNPSEIIFRQERWHTQAITSLTFSSNGRYLASGSNDGTINILDLESMKLIDKLKGEGNSQVTAVLFSVDSKYLIAGFADGRIFGWYVDTPKFKEQFKFVPEEQLPPQILALAVSPNGAILASGSRGGVIKLWSLSTAKEVKQFSTADQIGNIRALAYCKGNNNILFSGSDDNKVIAWKASN